MLIEQLYFRVLDWQSAAFAEHNRRWRAALARHPGFLGQWTYRREDDPTAWLVVVHWRDRAAMETFPSSTSASLEARGQALGALERVEFYTEVEG